MHKLLSLVVTAVFGLALAACGDGSSALTSTEIQTNERSSVETASLENIGVLPVEDGEGTVTLRRDPGDSKFTWKVQASGLESGHAFTAWVLNGTDPFGDDGGRGAGGLTGGNGRVTASGNHCLDSLEDGGFNPGTGKECDLIDTSGAITFVLIEHEKWAAGDILEFWTPTGEDGVITGLMAATFEAP